MSSDPMSPDPQAHPAPEALDRIAGGKSSAPAAREHVASCAACRATVGGLRAVRAELAAQRSRTPEPPAEVRQRIEAALAAESARRADPAPATDQRAAVPVDVGPVDAGPVDAGPVDAGPVPAAAPLPTPGPARPPRWLAAAAALVVLGGAAVTATELLGPGEQSASSQGEAAPAADAAPDAETGAAAAEPGPGEPPRDAQGGAQGGVLGGGAPEPGAALDGDGDGDGDGAVTVVATGTDYAPGTLAAQVGDLLAGAAGPGRAGSDADTDTGADAGATDLAGCLRALGLTPSSALVVDLARWRGEPATVVVAPGDGGRVRVLVAGPGCGSGSGDADLRHTARVPR